MRIEQIVRPFQVTGERRVVSTGVQKQVREAGVTWGAAGTLPSPVESAPPGPAQPINFIVKGLNQKNIQQPAKNQYERVKIQQEGNPDNFVVVQRLKKATFDDPKPRYLASPESPAVAGENTAKVPSGPTNFRPGPGDPVETVLPNSQGTETVLPNSQGEVVPLQGPRGDAVAYNARINAAIAARTAAAQPPPIKFDTHEYQFDFGAPGPNEVPLGE